MRGFFIHREIEMNFQKFKAAVSKQFAAMLKIGPLFETDTNPDAVYQLYLDSFPKGTNPIFRERSEHDCTCCRQFIKQIGHAVVIKDNKLISIWDIDPKGVDEGYVAVANALATKIKALEIKGLWLHYENKVGTTYSFESLADGKQKQWDHFHVSLPAHLVRKNSEIASEVGTMNNNYNVFRNGLTDLNYSAVEVVMELLAVPGAIYRGEEHLATVKAFADVKKVFDTVPKAERPYWIWNQVSEVSGSVVAFKNTVIGTLVKDISEGMEIEDAVKRFESKVAPTNYKRTSAAVTPRMVEEAKKTVKQEGYEASLQRRHATMADMPLEHILFKDSKASAVLASEDPFNNLATAPAVVSKPQVITLDSFLKDVLPTAHTVEVLLENRLRKNIATLVAPMDATAPSMFAWNNAFSWSYMNAVASSIRERVKEEGGETEGDLCCRLSWEYKDDLDFYMREPNGHIIYFGNRGKESPNGGKLDVDANGMSGQMEHPVENIVYKNLRSMGDGVYNLYVNNYNRREPGKNGFIVELEFNGSLLTIEYDKAIREGERVNVAHFEVKDGQLKLLESLPSKETKKNIAGLDSQQFHKVSIITKSPNYWGRRLGNEHTFFMLDGLKMEGPVRGFYNEFLAAKLVKHSKVFEILAGKMLVPDSVDQLTGIGLNSSEHETLTVRVTGNNLQRVFKVSTW
jgi:hypothetical protein